VVHEDHVAGRPAGEAARIPAHRRRRASARQGSGRHGALRDPARAGAPGSRAARGRPGALGESPQTHGQMMRPGKARTTAYPATTPMIRSDWHPT
jgi:hypothetical protein